MLLSGAGRQEHSVLLYLFGKLPSISREEVDTGKRSRQRQSKSTGYISSAQHRSPQQQQQQQRTRCGFVEEIPFSRNLSVTPSSGAPPPRRVVLN